jgi:AcrR family transcriptional regulator
MSNITRSAVRDPDDDVDPRIARSTRALGRALVELIQERDYREVTVQQVLDRAGVGRATFYAHYRNKDDVLHSSYDRLFAALEPLAARPSPTGPRLFPVAEFLGHLGDARTLVEGLRRAGQLEEAWGLFTGYMARIIERQLATRPRMGRHISRPLVARMLAGALMESVRWWINHPVPPPPAEMDAAFHELARGATRD